MGLRRESCFKRRAWQTCLTNPAPRDLRVARVMEGLNRKPKMSCRIDRVVGAERLVVLFISGRITGEHVDMLRSVLDQEECQRWRFVAMCDANSIMVLNLAACHQIRERLNEQTFDGPLQRAGAISEIDALGQQELPGAGRHIYKEWLTGGSSLDALLHEVELN